MTTKYLILQHRSSEQKEEKSKENFEELLSSYLLVSDLINESFDKGLAYGIGHLYVGKVCVNAADAWQNTEQKK